MMGTFYRNMLAFGECVRDYLEQVAGVKFIGNQLTRWMKQSRKPAHMPPDAWNQRLLELQGYIDNGMLRTSIVEQRPRQIQIQY